MAPVVTVPRLWWRWQHDSEGDVLSNVISTETGNYQITGRNASCRFAKLRSAVCGAATFKLPSWLSPGASLHGPHSGWQSGQGPAGPGRQLLRLSAVYHYFRLGAKLDFGPLRICHRSRRHWHHPASESLETRCRRSRAGPPRSPGRRCSLTHPRRRLGAPHSGPAQP